VKSLITLSVELTKWRCL